MFQLADNTSLSQNFQLWEFACADGSKEVKIDWKLIKLLQILREIVDRPIIINSAYRTVKYNEKVGGIKGSYHTTGQAADIRVPGMTPLEVAYFTDYLGFLGVGAYPTFTHVDVMGDGHGGKLYWTDDGKRNKKIIKSLKEVT